MNKNLIANNYLESNVMKKMLMKKYEIPTQRKLRRNINSIDLALSHLLYTNVGKLKSNKFAYLIRNQASQPNRKYDRIENPKDYKTISYNKYNTQQVEKSNSRSRKQEN